MRRAKRLGPVRAVVLTAAVAGGLAACTADAGESGGASSATDRPAVVVTIDEGRFSPAEIVVAAGTTVTFVNQDVGAHTATAAADAAVRYDSEILPSGSSFSHTFETPGAHAYVCTLHPTMRGTVTVE